LLTRLRIFLLILFICVNFPSTIFYLRYQLYFSFRLLLYVNIFLSIFAFYILSVFFFLWLIFRFLFPIISFSSFLRHKTRTIHTVYFPPFSCSHSKKTLCDRKDLRRLHISPPLSPTNICKC
jgi:hypothetical protein